MAIAAGLFLTSLVDFPLRIYANSLFFAFFLAGSAWLFEPPRDIPFSAGRSSRLLRFLPGAVVAASLFFSSILLYAEIRFENAVKFEKNFQWTEAEREYQQAVKADPFEERFLRAFGAFSEKRRVLSTDRQKRGFYRAEAIRLYEQAARQAPFAGGYPYLLGRLYESEERIPEATEAFRKAVKLEPGNALFVSEFGYFALKYLDGREAVPAFEKFQSISFKEGSRGKPCDILEAAGKKVTNYEDLKRMVSTTYQDRLCLGMALGRQGQWELARREFNSALETARQKEIYEAYAAYAREPVAGFYIAQGRPADALEVFRGSAAFHPGDPYVESKIRALEPAVPGTPRSEA